MAVEHCRSGACIGSGTDKMVVSQWTKYQWPAKSRHFRSLRLKNNNHMGPMFSEGLTTATLPVGQAAQQEKCEVSAESQVFPLSTLGRYIIEY